MSSAERQPEATGADGLLAIDPKGQGCSWQGNIDKDREGHLACSAFYLQVDLVTKWMVPGTGETCMHMFAQT